MTLQSAWELRSLPFRLLHIQNQQRRAKSLKVTCEPEHRMTGLTLRTYERQWYANIHTLI